MKIRQFVLLLIIFNSAYSFSQGVGGVSYYSNKLIGRKTTNGERYDAKAFTCAHRTYPFGTILKVTNIKNERFVIVRVNDRGPYHKSRIVDLSYAAALKIDLVRFGHGTVRVEEAEDLRFLLYPETLLPLSGFLPDTDPSLVFKRHSDSLPPLKR